MSKLTCLVFFTRLPKLLITIAFSLPIAPDGKSSGFFPVYLAISSIVIGIVSIHEECGGIEMVIRDRKWCAGTE